MDDKRPWNAIAGATAEAQRALGPGLWHRRTLPSGDYVVSGVSGVAQVKIQTGQPVQPGR
jgi:hypothetical protein